MKNPIASYPGVTGYIFLRKGKSEVRVISMINEKLAARMKAGLAEEIDSGAVIAIRPTEPIPEGWEAFDSTENYK